MSKYVYRVECGAGPIRVQPLNSWKPKEEIETSAKNKIELLVAFKM